MKKKGQGTKIDKEDDTRDREGQRKKGHSKILLLKRLKGEVTG